VAVTIVDTGFKKSKLRKKDKREITKSNTHVPKLSFRLTALAPTLVLEEINVCGAVLKGTFLPDGNCRLSTKGRAAGHRFLQLLGGRWLNNLTK
jgi:hypothetical protein